MRTIKNIALFLILALVVATLHYSLPSRDVVRVVGTDVKRMDVGKGAWFWAKQDAGTYEGTTRDVRFINTVWPNGKPRVYRNEDTNWSWPPYLKFDSGNLNAQAQALAKEDDEVWVAVSHYGWRNKLFSLFPNAYRVKPVTGPDVFLFPWFNVLFLGAIALILFWLYRRARRFHLTHIDPITDRMGEMVDTAEDYAASAQASVQKRRSGFRAFLKRWFG